MEHVDDNEWRIIPGFENYRINRNGDLQSCSNKHRVWRPMQRINVKSQPYQYYHLKKKFRRAIHHFVLLTFVGPKPEGMQCRHLDGNPKNNHISNLKWGTPKENTADKSRHGSILRGEKNPSSKLTNQQRMEIQARYLAGEKQSQLAKAFKVDQTSISNIVRQSPDYWAC